MDPEEEEALLNSQPSSSQPSTSLAAIPSQPTPSIPLAFGVAGGDAWDDSELVNAWDSAAEEWKLHNPGPGSWLDKATAAMALGQPLPGAKSLASKWYSSTSPAKPSTSATTQTNDHPNGLSANATKKQKQKRKRQEQTERHSLGEGCEVDPGMGLNGISRPIGPVLPSEENPYLSTSNHKRVRISTPNDAPNPYVQAQESQGPTSPSFTPASPRYSPSLPNGLGATSTSYQPSQSGVYPPPSTLSLALPPTHANSILSRAKGMGLSKEEASQRAHQAGWWSGYWTAWSEILPPQDEM